MTLPKKNWAKKYMSRQVRKYKTQMNNTPIKICTTRLLKNIREQMKHYKV